MTVSTHVLDASAGRPAGGVAVALSFVTLPAAGRLSSRARPTGTAGTGSGLRPGLACTGLVFGTGAYFAARGVAAFYPEVTITFTASGGHDHVPLLLSPFAYSTYRGS